MGIALNPAAPAALFAEIFREEHRKVRDLLLDLIRAFRDRDRARAGSLLEETAALLGPHFRYEEEALYPALVGIFGSDYVQHLLGEHDRAIGAAVRVLELAGRDPLTRDDVAEAIYLVRGILPHVSDCEGLSLIVEVLDTEEVQSILDARELSLRAGLDLLRWSSEVRRRPIVLPE